MEGKINVKAKRISSFRRETFLLLLFKIKFRMLVFDCVFFIINYNNFLHLQSCSSQLMIQNINLEKVHQVEDIKLYFIIKSALRSVWLPSKSILQNKLSRNFRIFWTCHTLIHPILNNFTNFQDIPIWPILKKFQQILIFPQNSRTCYHTDYV